MIVPEFFKAFLLRCLFSFVIFFLNEMKGIKGIEDKS